MRGKDYIITGSGIVPVISVFYWGSQVRRRKNAYPARLFWHCR